MLSDLCSSNLLRSTVCAILSVRKSGFDVVFLARAVDGHLDCDLATLDLLAVHLVDCFLLQFLRTKSDEAEATALARFVASLQFLNHEARDWTESNFRRGWLVGLEEFLELGVC